MPSFYSKIDLSEKKTNNLKSKYFIVVLSTERNLSLCRNNLIAGFPETDNGQWAFLDIDIGDYISFYFNGRVWDLYEVSEKLIPNRWRTEVARGTEERDPEQLDNGEKWDSIKAGGEFIYFPFRLKLKRIVQTYYESNIVFKNGFERLGMNLVPRVSLKKTHFQLSVQDIKRYFQENVPLKEKQFDINSFILCKKRSQRRHNKDSSICFENSDFNEIMHKELYFQSLMKKILEAYRHKIKILNNDNEYEFLSEQTTVGGESDIVILCKAIEDLEFYIELKRKNMMKKNEQLTKEGKEAEKQVKGYQNIKHKDLTLRAIGGINTNGDNSLRIYETGKNMLVFELDGNTSLSLFS